MLIHETIKLSKQGDQNATVCLINKFRPLINKYNWKCYSDDIESELIIAFLKALKRIKIEEFNLHSEGESIKYFTKVIHNAYIDIIKQSSIKNYYISNYVDLNTVEVEDPDDNYADIELKLYIEWLLSFLSNDQREIIMDIYYRDKKITDIAFDKKISKQAVSNQKSRSLEKLKNINFIGGTYNV